MAAILALDTSTEACSCALNIDGTIVEQYAFIPRQHAASLLPMVRDLLHQGGLTLKGLDAVAFGRGPGSFTGLRIAAGVTQGIAFAADLPVIPVSTLAAMALDVHRKHGATHILSCLDARIDEVYWAQCRVADGAVELVPQEYLCKPEAMAMAASDGDAGWQRMTAAGSGLAYVDRFGQELRESIAARYPDILPRASSIAELAARQYAAGATIPAEQAAPLYLRDKVTSF